MAGLDDPHFEQLTRMVLELDEGLAAKFKKAVDALTLVRKLEWIDEPDLDRIGENARCPCCGGRRSDGHGPKWHPDCELWVLVRP